MSEKYSLNDKQKDMIRSKILQFMLKGGDTDPAQSESTQLFIKDKIACTESDIIKHIKRESK